jgi:hypothetical protein
MTVQPFRGISGFGVLVSEWGDLPSYDSTSGYAQRSYLSLGYFGWQGDRGDECICT